MCPYPPKIYQSRDQDLINTLVKQYPLGLYITPDEPYSQVTATPFLLEGTICRGHVHGMNPQADYEGPAKIVFQGPNAYISASWYEAVSVSTWNYISVQLSGTIRILSGAESEQLLVDFQNTFEARNHTQHFAIDRADSPISRDYWDNLKHGISAFEMDIEDQQLTLKLSQNKSPTDQQSIIHSLRKKQDHLAQDLADWMEKILF